jgi:hypothetical protein
MSDLSENCDVCYRACLSQLPASIVINGGLTATTNYILKVTDKFGNKYSTPPTATDGSGNLTVAVPGTFPAQWFNRDAGVFKFEASLTAQPWAPATLTFGANTYTCILVEFVNDASNINTIQ